MTNPLDYVEAQEEVRSEKPYLPDYPDVEGVLEISVEEDRVFIGGDPQGLLSLAKMLEVLANVNQELMNTPQGAREHIHLRPHVQLSDLCAEVQLCHLDAAWTGEFPERYKPQG